MENIGKGVGQFIVGLFVLAILIGMFIISAIFLFSGKFSNSFESKEKVILPIDYRLEINEKSVDTIYIYKKL